jgi:hypothetical protein
MGYEETGFSEAEWLRLAAPRPLPATVRAVLEKVEALDFLDMGLASETSTESADALNVAVDKWIAAGRPGMEDK